jgi:hypothetical protein
MTYKKMKKADSKKTSGVSGESSSIDRAAYQIYATGKMHKVTGEMHDGRTIIYYTFENRTDIDSPDGTAITGGTP